MEDRLFPYRRHAAKCKFKNDERHNLCRCPVYSDGYNEKGKRIRRSLKTRSWDKALQRLEQLEGGSTSALRPAQTLGGAVADFLADIKRRDLARGTQAGYRGVLQNLTKDLGATVKLTALTPPDLRAAASLQKGKPGTRAKKVTMMKTFFDFCVDQNWIAVNEAKKVKRPKPDAPPTEPFSDDEIERMLDAASKLKKNDSQRMRLRARALILLMANTGLRIGDAMRLARANVNFKTGKIMLHAEKNGKPVYVRVKEHVLDALRALPVESPQHFFWSGTSQKETAGNSGWRLITRVAKEAKVLGAHPHRFRDSFAVNLLLGGVDIRTVQKLLGHSSLQITEKHYSPWDARMQDRLDEAVDVLPHFGSSPQFAPLPPQHAVGNSQSNLLAFARRTKAG